MPAVSQANVRPRTRDIEVPVVHERTAEGAHKQGLLNDNDPSKRYSLPIQIDLDHLHDPNYRIALPSRGSLDVVYVCVFSVVCFLMFK